MKKLYIISFTLLNIFAYAQNKVGINQNNPEATLDINAIADKANVRFDASTGSVPTSLLIQNSDIKVLSINTTTPEAAVHAENFNETSKNSIFSIEDKDSSEIFLRYYDNMQSGDFNSANLGGKGLVYSTGGKNEGFYIGNLSDKNGGIYIGEDGNNGIGLTRKPTAKLDIANHLVMVFSKFVNEGEACTNLGEIVPNSNGIFGCTKAGWKKFNN
ncbi:hypothetical protein [Ornithobacterium rhinotracheale]|uniref:hypothetical protein n=1 Tax=Ornithobacterium rhinotracheale TaxID=28251 RepID=UPI003FCF6281